MRRKEKKHGLVSGHLKKTPQGASLVKFRDRKAEDHNAFLSASAVGCASRSERSQARVKSLTPRSLCSRSGGGNLGLIKEDSQTVTEFVGRVLDSLTWAVWTAFKIKGINHLSYNFFLPLDSAFDWLHASKEAACFMK